MKPFYDQGLHVGQLTRQTLTKASSGNRQLNFSFKILGTPNPGENTYTPHGTQYERTVYLTITEKTIPFIVEKLKLLDFQGSKFSQLDPANPNHVSMVGQIVDLWCKHEPGQTAGDMKERWDISRGATVTESEPLNAKEARELDALFGKAMGKPKAEPMKAAAQSRPREDEIGDLGITDEDIPF